MDSGLYPDDKHTYDEISKHLNFEAPIFKDFVFPHEAVVLLTLYALEDYPKFLRLNRGWNTFVRNAFEDYLEKSNLEINFNAHYLFHLTLVKSYISATPI